MQIQFHITDQADRELLREMYIRIYKHVHTNELQTYIMHTHIHTYIYKPSHKDGEKVFSPRGEKWAESLKVSWLSYGECYLNKIRPRTQDIYSKTSSVLKSYANHISMSRLSDCSCFLIFYNHKVVGDVSWDRRGG